MFDAAARKKLVSFFWALLGTMHTICSVRRLFLREKQGTGGSWERHVLLARQVELQLQLHSRGLHINRYGLLCVVYVRQARACFVEGVRDSDANVDVKADTWMEERINRT